MKGGCAVARACVAAGAKKAGTRRTIPEQRAASRRHSPTCRLGKPNLVTTMKFG